MKSQKFFHQNNPSPIPVPDLKMILEHFGKVATNSSDISIAHMIAPPGWSEPFQTPDFDEYTLMLRGKKILEIEGEKVTVSAGESILIKKGTRVRYSNPFEEEAEYWAICTPAFSIEAVHREDV
ncbi:MAG: cupin domain-containing protein [Leptospiraceae bacterium]|nr:cupin domain-containing protein [Leptospiraceae bacterium]